MPTENTPPDTAKWLARFGHAMRKHQRRITIVQWTVVGVYALLLFVPIFLPLPTHQARIVNHFQRFAQFLFWGVGWPLIFLSMMLFGRAWCGIFCPDGTLTETLSRHGRQQSIPRWIRWSGWPCTMLIFTTVYGQMVGVYDTHWGTLLLLGLPTLGALWCGYAYGNGKRIWCMYLCPANAPFGLLSRIAPLHFRVDESKWKQHPPPLPRVDCPPLIDIRRMKSNSACHMCGRCSGHLNAVTLAARFPHEEILTATNRDIRTADAITLIFGLLGVCTVAIKWSEHPWLAWLKSALAHSPLSALQHYTAPWWLLANHPTENRVFINLLDGLSLLLYILGVGLLLGLFLFASLKLSTRIARNPTLTWQKLSLALIPVGGVGMFLGLSTFTITHLKQAGLVLSWIPPVQFALLALGGAFSLWLGAKLIVTRHSARHVLGLVPFTLGLVLLLTIWVDKLLG